MTCQNCPFGKTFITTKKTIRIKNFCEPEDVEIQVLLTRCLIDKQLHYSEDACIFPEVIIKQNKEVII